MSAYTFKPEFEEFINKWSKENRNWQTFINFYYELSCFGTVNVSLDELYELWKRYVIEYVYDNNMDAYHEDKVLYGEKLPHNYEVNAFAVWLSKQ